MQHQEWLHPTLELESHPPRQMPPKQPIGLVQHLGSHLELEEPWDYTRDYSVWPKSSHPTKHEQPKPSVQ